MVSGIFVNESGRMLVSLFVWIGKRVTILLPIFFYHKLAQSLLTMGLGLVVTPPASIGKTFKVNLVEPLPRPNASGDYTSSNANTWLTETAGSGTWSTWRVTSRDGQLNCRKTPNKAIQQVFY